MPFKKYDIRISAAPAAKRRRLDLDIFIPFFVIAISNKLTASASRLLLHQFDCGVTEWRILSMLATEPNIAPGRITSAVGIDKSSVSRALRHLERRGCVNIARDPTHGRRQVLSLTEEGQALHDRIIGDVLQREELLLTDFDPVERAKLVGYLKRMLDNVALVVQWDGERLKADRGEV